MDWTLLGISPTKDKKAITAAYRTQVVKVNPEDKPDEFKALRAAYEEALRLAAEQEVQQSHDDSPVGLWLEKVRALYNDFPARITPENWKLLLSDDVCVSLDKRPLAEEALLRFLMEDYFIPQEVWQLFDSTFSLMERRDELYEKYPREFVDHAVLNGIRYKASLPYALFTPGINAAECDAFRRLYYRANQTAPAELGPVLEQMDALSESHPYGQALAYRHALAVGDKTQAEEGFRALAEAYPQDTTLTMNWASLCVQKKDWAEGERLARRVLSIEPTHWNARRMLADCLAGQGNHKDAKDQIYDLMDQAGGDQMQLHQLHAVLISWNEEIIIQREAVLRDHPEDSENAMELAWCYLQNDKLDDALRAALAADPAQEDQYGYNNLLSKLYYSRGEFEKALGYMQVLEALIRAMEPDGTEKTQKRMQRLPEVLQLEGSCMMQLGRNEHARLKYEQALQIAPEKPEILTNMGRLLYGNGEFARAAEVLEKLTEVLPGSYHGYYLLSLALFELGRDRDAFNAINRAQQLEGSDLGVYILKMRILIRNGVWDEVHNIIQFLQQHGITDDLSVLWCEAQLAEFEQKDEPKALELYQQIADRLEAGEHIQWPAKVYFRITVLLGNQRDASKKEDRAQMLQILEKGLLHDPRDEDCLDYKAWLLKRGGNVKDALDIYLQLEANPRHPLSVERNLADLYYKDLAHNAQKALHYYQILLDKNEHPDLHFYAGTCKRYLGDLAGARMHFLREQELAADDIDGFNGLAYVYEAMGLYEAALEQVDKAIALVQDRERDYSWLYGHKVQILRRLKRPQEALRTVCETMAKYEGYKAGYKLRFEICCQFGLWDTAQQTLEEWKKNEKINSDIAAAIVNLNLYTGHMIKAKLAQANWSASLDEEDAEAIKLQLADLDCDSSRQIEIWNKRLKNRTEQGGDTTHALMNLAEAQWHSSGNRVNAVSNAQKALTRLDKVLTQNLTNEALYRGRRAVVLALLGREGEAREELAKVRRLPLCQSCAYSSCKDADIFEAAIEEIFGNYRKALALYRAGKETWPDELDFTSGENRTKRKGK